MWSPTFYSFPQGIPLGWNVNKSQTSCFNSFHFEKRQLKKLPIFQFQLHSVLVA